MDTTEGLMDRNAIDNTEPCLTPREREVLGLARRGYRNSEIAEQLGITRNAVRFHLKEIHSKLGTDGERSRLERGWRYGLSLAGFPFAKLGTGAAVTAISAVLAAGGYLAYQEHPREALAAPERFEGAVTVDDTITSQAATPESTPQAESSEFWTAAISGMPAGGAVVSKEDTILGTSRGICAAIQFSSRGSDHQLYRMTIDQQDVASDATWIAQDLGGGTLCYARTAGLEPGEHILQVSRDEPWGGTFKATWTFTVAP